MEKVLNSYGGRKDVIHLEAVGRTYTVRLIRLDDEQSLNFYINGEQTGMHYCNLTNKPLWLISNLQMKGTSGDADGLRETSYSARNVSIKKKGAS